MEKIVKLVVVLGALMAGGGVFYHYVIFLPGMERQKTERAEQEKREAATQGAIRQQLYESCNVFARKNYDANWATACKSVAQLTVASLRNCLSNSAIMTNPYMGQQYCQGTFGDTDPSPHCGLPTDRAGAINQAYREEQEKCLAEARLGL